VWTSDVNANDKPDLNEAFFIKRERGPDDPLVRAGRRFAGPNRWRANLPGFREAVLAYTDAVPPRRTSSASRRPPTPTS
jgi:isopenicillin N synthase-like dioxygenase